MRQDAGDYLYPVDSNVRPFSKLNALTTRTLDLQVQLDANGNARNTLEATWDNRVLEAEGTLYRALPGETGAARDLGTYFRLLVPEGSRLESALRDGDPVTEAADLGSEAGRAVIANYVRVRPGSASLESYVEQSVGRGHGGQGRRVPAPDPEAAWWEARTDRDIGTGPRRVPDRGCLRGPRSRGRRRS